MRRWLYKIATTACLTALETRARRPLPSGLGAPAEDHRVAVAAADPSVPWLQPIPDALLDPAAVVAGRAGVRLAFVAALQLLPARQRAVLTLRDVLAFRTAEVAEMLGTTPAAVDSALRRARDRLADAGPVEADLTEPAEHGPLLDRYVDAFVRADPGALVDAAACRRRAGDAADPDVVHRPGRGGRVPDRAGCCARGTGGWCRRGRTASPPCSSTRPPATAGSKPTASRC